MDWTRGMNWIYEGNLSRSELKKHILTNSEFQLICSFYSDCSSGCLVWGHTERNVSRRHVTRGLNVIISYLRLKVWRTDNKSSVWSIILMEEKKSRHAGWVCLTEMTFPSAPASGLSAVDCSRETIIHSLKFVATKTSMITKSNLILIKEFCLLTASP